MENTGSHINPFHATGTSENQMFSDVFKGKETSGMKWIKKQKWKYKKKAIW